MADTPSKDDKQIVMSAVRRRRGSYGFLLPNMRNDNSIDPHTLLLILVLVGALIGSLVGAQDGVSGSGMGIIWGAVVGIILAKFINH